MKLSIVYKFSLISVFLVLMSTGVVGWIFHTKITTILVENTVEHIALDAKVAGDMLQQIVNAHDEDVLFLANTPPFQGMIRAHSAGGIDKKDTTSYAQWVLRMETIFESLLKRKDKFLMVRFIDKTGQELVSVRRQASKIIREKGNYLQNKAHRDYVRETLKLPVGKIYLSEINLNREFGKVAIPHQKVLRIATPIYDERNNEIAGLVIITVEIARELDLIQERLSKDGDTDIYITNDRGGYLLHPNKERTYGFDLEKRYRVQEDIPQLAVEFLPDNLNLSITLLPEDTNGRDVVTFTKIPFDITHSERFIAVIIKQNHDSIVEKESLVLNEIVMWALLLAMAGVGLAIFFSVRITRPIQEMTLAVNKFSHSHSSELILPVTLEDEVGVLARAFISMTEQVKQSRAELEGMNANLESKVVARTEDLNIALVEAKRANQAKSEFLSRMSHELRTPMNAILGFGQILELDAENFNDVQRGNVNEILEAGNHLLELINEVLDMTKIEAGTLQVDMNKVLVAEVLQESISLIQTLAATRHIKIIDHISAKNHAVLADKFRLKQVLLNLLSNAVKYNCENGRIILDAKIIDKQRLRINVTDSGEGLSQKDIRKLFTPFERLNMKHNIEGVGIGLVITKQLVELMGGEIGIESTPGEGCTFWVEFELNN